MPRRKVVPERRYTVELDATAFNWLHDMVRAKAARYGDILAHYGPMAKSAAAAFEEAARQHEPMAETAPAKPIRRIKRRATPEPEPVPPPRRGRIKRKR